MFHTMSTMCASAAQLKMNKHCDVPLWIVIAVELP